MEVKERLERISLLVISPLGTQGPKKKKNTCRTSLYRKRPGKTKRHTLLGAGGFCLFTGNTYESAISKTDKPYCQHNIACIQLFYILGYKKSFLKDQSFKILRREQREEKREKVGQKVGERERSGETEKRMVGREIYLVFSKAKNHKSRDLTSMHRFIILGLIHDAVKINYVS